MDKWDSRYLQLAEHVASWSKDPSTKTGAVIVDVNGDPVSIGFNGFPRGVADTPERLNNRDLKYQMIVHCERNAMLFAKRDLYGSTLYTYPFMSCAACAAMVVQAGIKRCVAPISDNPRWQESFRLTEQIFQEGGVKLDLMDYTPGLLLREPAVS